MKRIIFALLITVLLSVMFCFAVSADDVYFEQPAGTVYMQYGTPKIDGNISSGEGWGASVNLNKKNLIPVMVQAVTTYPSGDVRYAYDENYLYFAADITDDDYILCTKYFKDNYVRNGFGKPTSFFAFDGDVIALAFDWNNLIASDIGYLTDRPSYFCFGLFEDGHVGAYHTVFGEKDLSGIAKTAGKRTADGWCFEAAIPWDEIDADFDANSFTNLHFDYETMTDPSADNKACVYFVDRFDDPETGDVQLDNVYASYQKCTHEGGLSSHLDYFFYGVFGIDLRATKNGGKDVPKTERLTSLVWKDPFTELDKKAWYYNAVSTACDNGWFAGMTKTTFVPSGQLTRAMFVKVLASLARYDGTEATGTMYNDIPANKWYSASVEWATNAGIAAGMGGGNFSPDSYLTREQAALFLYKFAQFKKYRVDGVKSGVIDGYPDRKDVSGWAVTALEWAVDNGFISGNKNGNTVYLDPKGTATRAQCAQIVNAFNNTAFTHFAKNGELATLTVCGSDISEYVIIYGAEDQDKTSANELVKYIKLTTGVTVSAYRDTAKEATDKEILIGKTNREAYLPEVDRDGVGPEEFMLYTFGDEKKVLIFGGKEKGTLFGTYWFIEEYLGWVYGDGNCEERYYAPEIVIEGGISEKHGSMMKQVSWCEGKIDSTYKKKLALYGETVQADDGVQCGIAFLFENLDWDEFVIHHKDDNPCYSDPETIDFLTDMMLKRMANQPNQNVFSFGAYDSNIFCTCDKCLAVYREEGSRGGTYMRLTNHVAEAVKEKYPGNRIVYMAYSWATDVTKTKPADNVIVRFVNIAACFHHNITDPNCPHNRPLYKNLLKWSEISSTLWLGEHGNTFRYCLSPVMNFDFLYTNIGFYNDLGCSGFIYWGNDGNAEFNPTRDYLIGHMFRYPDMTRDQYRIYMESNLEARYGAAWRDLIEYTDIMDKAQQYVHFSSHPDAEGTISADLFDSRVDRLDELWTHMYDVTEEGSEEYKNLDTTFVNYLFIRQTVEWDKEYAGGDEVSKAAYVARNEKVYNIFDKYGIRWSEYEDRPGGVDFTRKPGYWSEH